MRYHNYGRPLCSPQFIRHFFAMWLPKWRWAQPFVLKFYAYNNYRLEFFPNADASHEDRLTQMLQQKDLCWELRSWRLQKLLSATEMAKLCNMSLSNYAALERGRRAIGPKTRLQILAAIKKYAELLDANQLMLGGAQLKNLKDGNLST